MSDVLQFADPTALNAELAAGGTPLLVDFSATWCGPCKALSPVLEKLATERKGSLRVLKVDVDEHQALAAKVGIRSVPTLLLVKDGQVLAAKSGALSYAALSAFADQAA